MREECKFCQNLDLSVIPPRCKADVKQLFDGFPCPNRTSPIVLTNEQDPTGRKPNDPGAKLDHGKNRLGLVLFGFARALQAVGRVGTYGATKYSDNGWMQVPDGERRYTDALMRHLMKEATGEEKDTDTDLLHASHAAWNALARLELMLREREAKQ